MKKKNCKIIELNEITIPLTAASMSGITEITYNEDGTKTITRNIPIMPDDPVFSAISPDFIPQRKED